MKRIALFIVIGIFAISVPSCAQKFPQFEKGIIIKDGDILIKQGIYKNKDEKNIPKEIKADFITMAVRENRNNPKSRIITIPVLRIHSLSSKPKEPVFMLNGGPGGSNISYSPLWLINQHDVVLVGYRGVDGSANLNLTDFAKAMIVDSNTFSAEHLKKMGKVLKNEMEYYSNEGIDLNSYNIVEVIDDIENGRIKLGYNKINLYAISYGTRLAYIYGLRYPNSIQRSCCQCINPPGGFCWNPEVVDNILRDYGEIWKKDSSNLKRSSDIVQTLRNVFTKLPVKWNKIIIDPIKVRVMMFNLLYSTNGAAQVFDAFVAAENGNYSGLACLVMMFDMLPEMGINWGDYIMKGGTADYVSGKNYITGTDSKENLLGADQSKLFAIIDLSDINISLIPEKYRNIDTSYVNTLLINGNLDVSTPLSNARELIKYLPNGRLIEVSDCSHNDTDSKQSEVFKKLVKEYFLTGQVKADDFKDIPANLGIPKKSLQQMGKTFYKLKRLGLLKIVAKMSS
jgi:pimeloyl-ACP methyl ester carboxylesterase